MIVEVRILELKDSVTLQWQEEYHLPQTGDTINLGSWIDEESERITQAMPASLLYDKNGWENDTLFHYLGAKSMKVIGREWYVDEETREQICFLTVSCSYE